MTSTQLLDLLKALFQEPLGLFWTGVAALLDWLRRMGPVKAGWIALAIVATAALLAWRLQWRLRRRLSFPAAARGSAARPPEGAATPVPGNTGEPRPPERDPHQLAAREIVWLEIGHSFLFLPIKPFQLLVAGLRGLGRGIGRLFARLRRRGPRPPEPKADAELSALVATLGPSFLLGGLLTVGIYLAARAVEPLVAARLGLSEGLSAWQFLAFGFRPELAWYLPLERFPYLAGVLAVAFWLAVWSLAATAVRLGYWKHLRKDLAWAGQDGKEPPLGNAESTLPFWRRWAGAAELWRADLSYRRWARWLVAVGLPLLAWAWLSLGGDPYRIGPSELAVGLVLWTSWGLHLLLEGKNPGKEKTAVAGDPPADRPHGWREVLEHLKRHDHAQRPEPFARWSLAPARPEPLPPKGLQVISPLVGQLLNQERQAAPRLTPMQREVLTILALQGFVHTDPPRGSGALTLGREAPEALEDRSGLRSRNLVVLAPESAGKSTLALLAVANHALVHTRSSLVVVADDARAETLARGFRRALDVTPLRWSVRVRSPGDDLMTDLSRGIAPDVLVVSLRDLVVTVLDRADSFEPFLRNLGLVVVDDVEAFTGPCEVHGQLAFRRLAHRVEELLGVENLGGRDLAAPQLLVLGTEGMHEASEWAQSLCGVEAVTRRYPETPADGGGPASGVGTVIAASVPAGAAQTDAGERNGHLPRVEQHRHRLRDFRTDVGDLLPLPALIGACEATGVPWHYRLCGDGRRDLGRGPLLLTDEPRCHVDDAEDACVLFLEGTWSEVQREATRLRRAGTRFARRRAPEPSVPGYAEEVALITMADPDVEMAFTQLDREFVLAPALASLPRPVLRPPTGRVLEPHLAADLTQHWTEVSDVTRIFGDSTAGILDQLAQQNLLQAEERVDIAPKVNDYVQRLYVRALARAVQGGDGDGGEPGPTQAVLPPRVAQVDLVSSETVSVRDRTSLQTLACLDAPSAPFVFYPGRIFRDARGSFVVVGSASDETERSSRADSGSPADGRVVRKGDVLVEPILSDAVSSPRRSLRVTKLDEKRDPRWHRELVQSAGGALLPASRVLLGREPIELSLEAVWVDVEHVATYRLGPVYCEVRQRTIQPERTGPAKPAAALPTVALRLWPNPDPREEDRAGEPPEGKGLEERPPAAVEVKVEDRENEERETDDTKDEELGAVSSEAQVANADGPAAGEPVTEDETAEEPGAELVAGEAARDPVLSLEAARLLAATMRAVLPTMYRGGTESVGVAVQVAAREGSREHPESEAGVENTPVLPGAGNRPPRIDLFLFDTDAGGNGAARAIYRDGIDLLLRLCRLVVERVLSLDRLLAIYDEWGDHAEIHQEARAEAGAGKRMEDLARERRKKHESLRLSLLKWLDSRLPPEAGAEGQRDLARYYQRGRKEGEGGVIDLQRCFYSADGSVTDLLWSKHRWQDLEVGELMLDVGFDRKTFLDARRLRESSQEWLKRDKERYPEEVSDAAKTDSPVTPQHVWCRLDPEKPVNENFLGERFEDLRLLLFGLLRAAPESLAPLARHLARAPAGGSASTAGKLAAFVQGIPNFQPPAASGTPVPFHLVSPIEALLERRGNSFSKALLLAALLQRAGFESGIFASFKEDGGRAFAAVEEDASGESFEERKPFIWAEIPRKQGGAKARSRFLPIDISRTAKIGEVEVRDPATWAFLPLSNRGSGMTNLETGSGVHEGMKSPSAPQLPPPESRPEEALDAPDGARISETTAENLDDRD